MSTEREVVGYLVFRKVVIHDANAISSPITYGFPAVTGFLGAFHNMSRTMQALPEFADYCLGGVLLACHDCQVQAYRPNKYRDYTFNQSRNPIKKDGKTASIIEEGKCHLVMSFAVEILGEEELTKEHIEQITEQSEVWIQQNRIAGGSVRSVPRENPVQFIEAEDADLIAPLLLPAFVLVDAQDEFSKLIKKAQIITPEITPLDVLLDVSTLHHVPETLANGNIKWITKTVKQEMSDGHGWLVPMPIGYQGISDKYEAGAMQNARNPEYDSQYVEAIYGLGKWVYPQRLTSGDKIANAFWRYDHDTNNDLYLITQNPSF